MPILANMQYAVTSPMGCTSMAAITVASKGNGSGYAQAHRWPALPHRSIRIFVQALLLKIIIHPSRHRRPFLLQGGRTNATVKTASAHCLLSQLVGGKCCCGDKLRVRLPFAIS
ncbi:hypothetical protein ACQKWADRAFT_294422 [Trichoderma austrokoningii]